ncbi:hypothetical protein MLP_47440 [Microlunatus phosphovorus NM-1]|uniref:Uncharacterized protein n=1 Tax=Microlunatus phosphovorus (strain ATCC 700054 / DSM 10555 / JCM 9379 / NBRC 101784 / NCIMB 13414 / VKM Ac-1990 / NM-1) TaxID=1032480 RepID=F5XF20_MICPN|nr:hypothetical protein MLP_47440 [Microlunatus phosphovorus NM-1]
MCWTRSQRTGGSRPHSSGRSPTVTLFCGRHRAGSPKSSAIASRCRQTRMRSRVINTR